MKRPRFVNALLLVVLSLFCDQRKNVENECECKLELFCMKPPIKVENAYELKDGGTIELLIRDVNNIRVKVSLQPPKYTRPGVAGLLMEKKPIQIPAFDNDTARYHWLFEYWIKTTRSDSTMLYRSLYYREYIGGDSSVKVVEPNSAEEMEIQSFLRCYIKNNFPNDTEWLLFKNMMECINTENCNRDTLEAMWMKATIFELNSLLSLR